MKTKVLFAVTLLALLPASLMAQGGEKRGAFEINTGLSMAVSLPGETVSNVGAGAEALIHYRFAKFVGIYGGWGYNSFSNKYKPAGVVCDFEETGYVVGLQYKRPVELSRASVFVRGGLQFKHIEIEDPSGELLFDTTHGIGWQFGCGVDFPLGASWSLVTEMKFNALPEKYSSDALTTIPDRNYLTARLGILKRF